MTRIKEVDATDVDGKTVYEIKDDGTVTDKPVKENAIAGNVAKDGDKYKKLKYNPSTAQYEPGKETYEVKMVNLSAKVWLRVVVSVVRQLNLMMLQTYSIRYLNFAL